jgi:hypothetical protein
MVIISGRAAVVRQMPEREQPLSEQFRLVAVAYADAEAAASLVEELHRLHRAKGDEAQVETRVRADAVWRAPECRSRSSFRASAMRGTTNEETPHQSHTSEPG